MRDFLDCLVSFVMKIVSYQLIKRAINQLIIIHFSQNDKHCLQDLGIMFSMGIETQENLKERLITNLKTMPLIKNLIQSI